MAAELPAPLSIDIVSDAVCPWCFIGKRKLERALAMRPDLPVSIAWRPFQLDPTIPAGGLDRREYMERKFGSAEKLRAIQERIVAEGRENGITFHFEKIGRSPNTLDAHRLIRWSASTGAQDRVVETLFTRFFVSGDDIGDPAVLTAVAAEAGLDADLVAQLLAGDADKKAVQDEIASAAHVGVSAVPCFILAQRFAVPGAQDPEVLLRYIDKIVVKLAEEAGVASPA